ncbi:hypothetical protein EER27_09340 [Lysobacter psychrotolerans]|uniref:Uncharacterized protein n=2 Tax=Montanilutibacter psychrotolerans TaxID=1327343 RepID=A0A3M8SQK8_9GAMM|nr:hypothetical protein EER27_09340 [Lysobacter psychrotolerans]
MALQVAVVCTALIIDHVYSGENAFFKRKVSLCILIAAALSFILVRQPLLLSDTTIKKFYPSGSYRCPGVPQFWRGGV